MRFQIVIILLMGLTTTYRSLLLYYARTVITILGMALVALAGRHPLI